MKKLYKNILAIILSFSMVIGCLTVTSFGATIVESGSCGDKVTYTLDSEGVLTISGTGAMYDYGYISLPPFWDSREDILKLVINEGITGIACSFNYCNKLTSISIPTSITSLEEGAFAHCTGLKSIEIPSSVTSIGSDAFCNCSSLASIEIPSSVTYIGDWAFCGCSNLTSIEIPPSVTYIGDIAFYDVTATAYYYSDAWLKTMQGNYGGALTWVYKSHTHDWQEKVLANDANLKSVATNTTPAQYWKVCSVCGEISTTEFFEYGNPLSSIVESGKCGENATYTLDSDGLLTISGTRETYNYGGYGMEPLFLAREDVKKVVIEEGITSIGNQFFLACYGLTSIEIPTSVRSIGSDAFAHCCLLEGIDIPDSVLSIGNSAFECCGLTSIDIPSSITEICYGLFYYCTSLTSVNIPSSVKSIGDYAFADSGLTSVKIPSSVIGDNAFEGASNLKKVELTSSVTKIGSHAFSDCVGLTSIEIPSGLTSIGRRAFRGCLSLTTIEIPSSVTSIEENAFDEDTATVYYDNAAWLKTMQGDYGGNLTWVCKPHTHDYEDVWSYDKDQHWHVCTICEEVLDTVDHTFDNACDATCNECGYIRKTSHDWQETVLANDANLKTAATCTTPAEYWKVCSVCGEISTSEYFEYGDPILLDWGSCGDNVTYTLDRDGLLTISGTGNMHNYSSSGRSNASPFNSDYRIKNVVIEDGVTSIGDYAFEYCRYLTGIKIPESVITIGVWAFCECINLTSIEIPDGVTSIGSCAFCFCDDLTSIKIPEGVTSIGDGVFCGCGFANINIPSSVTSIGDSAFLQCYKLTSIEIPSSVTSIDANAFSECIKLTSIEIPSSVTSIGENAFDGVTATVYYDNAAWLETMQGNYGGNLTWVCKPHTHDYEDVWSYDETQHWHVCTICEEVLDTADHTFDNACDATCNECGYIRKTSHDWQETVLANDANLKAAATCTTPAEYWKTCSVCGEISTTEYFAYGSPISHNWQETVLTNDENLKAVATCTTPAEYWKVCSECDEISEAEYFTYGNPIAHNYAEEWETNDTQHWHECTLCHDKKDVENHAYDNACDTTCNVCGYTREISHNWQEKVLDNDVNLKSAATYTSAAQYWKVCSVCGEVSTTEYFEYGDPIHVKISVESKEVMTGDTFDITVEIKDNPGFQYLELTPNFDSSLTLVSVTNGELISDFTKAKQYIWVADEDVNENGTLMTLTFKTNEDLAAGNYKVGFTLRSCVNYDEEKIGVDIETGVVTAKDFIFGDANGDRIINGQDVIRLKKFLANYDYDTETSTVDIGKGADANGDGVINGQDVVRLKKYLANYDYDTETSTIVLGPTK